MPVEIKELLVEINVSNAKKTSEKESNDPLSAAKKKEMLTEFIEQMTALIDKKNER
jgi:hypothetical protein